MTLHPSLPDVTASVAAYAAFIAAVAVQRLWETRVGTRHARALLAQGGVEAGRGHLPVMIALHALFLAACPLEAWLLGRPFVPALAVAAGGVFVLTQALRYWAIGTLGERWTIRVIVLPGAPVIARGPYRFIRHPNYVAVVLEMLAIPLVHGAWVSALVFSLLNAALLARRIRVEERLLRDLGTRFEALDARPRFVPRG